MFSINADKLEINTKKLYWRQIKMNEEWKNIEGYEGLYQISDQGQVKNLRSGKILKPRKSKGYYYVCLYNK